MRLKDAPFTAQDNAHLSGKRMGEVNMPSRPFPKPVEAVSHSSQIPVSRDLILSLFVIFGDSSEFRQRLEYLLANLPSL